MDWMRTYREFVGRLSGVQDFGNGRGRACCPIHGDVAELWLAVGHEDQLIIRCYPRHSKTEPCTVADVVGRVGLDLRYLYPDWESKVGAVRKEPTKPKGSDDMAARKTEGQYTLEATHKYEDVDGKGVWRVVFEVLKKRYADGSKDMPQRRPNPNYNRQIPASKENPEWLWNLEGVRPVLYRMKELRAGLKEKRERWVFILEGEVKVDTARALGLLATCNPGGVLKWHHAWYKEELRGCNVVIVPDEDAADPTSGLARGLEHAKQVARDLLPVANQVKLMRVPNPEWPGWDFANWRGKQAGKVDEVKLLIKGMIDSAATMTPELLDGLKPFPFPPEVGKGGKAVGTVPPAATAPAAAVEPPKSEEKPAATPAAAKPAVAGSGPIVELEGYVRALNAASPAPRSAFEWLGEITAAKARFDKVFDVSNPAVIREAALALSAAIMRGVS